MSLSLATERLQTLSIPTADRRGAEITSEDWAWVEETLDIPVLEVAVARDRTYHAICAMRYLLRTGAVRRPPRVAASDRPYRGWVEGMGDE